MESNRYFLFFLTSLLFVAYIYIPSVAPMIHPDSSGYIEFSSIRTSFYPVFLDIAGYFGMSLNQIQYLQIFIFSLSVFFLLRTLLDLTSRKIIVLLYLLLLIGNIWLVSIHKSILTDSLYISFNLFAVSALINFFLKGSSKYLLIFSIMVGISIGIRPSGIYLLVLIPIIIFSAKKYLGVFRWKWVGLLIIPIIATSIIESTLYYQYHNVDDRVSLLPILVFGKGATMNGDIEFSGKHKNVLTKYSRAIDSEFGDVAPFLEKIPYFWLKNQSLPNYEIYAQFNVLKHKRENYATEANVSKSELMLELGWQRILKNPYQWLINSLHHYAASWGVRVSTFPPFVDEYNKWVLEQVEIPLNDSIKYLPLKGDLKPSIVSLIVFPALLFVGIMSGLIGIVFVIMIFTKKELPLLFVLSGLLSLMAHGSIMLSSIINVATPRFSITQIPILTLALLFLFLMLFERLKSSRTSKQ
jgi:hypothetical protein